MIKNAYGKIKAVIEYGHLCEVEFDDGSIRTFYKIDDNGDIECDETYFTEKQINELNITKITPLPRQFKKLKVGDKAIILENCREVGTFESWSDKHKDMVGKVFPVEEVFDDSDGVYYHINNYHFLHNCVAPYFEDDEKTEQLEKIEEKDLRDKLMPALQKNTEAINRIIDILNAFKKV